MPAGVLSFLDVHGQSRRAFGRTRANSHVVVQTDVVRAVLFLMSDAEVVTDVPRDDDAAAAATIAPPPSPVPEGPSTPPTPDPPSSPPSAAVDTCEAHDSGADVITSHDDATEPKNPYAEHIEEYKRRDQVEAEQTARQAEACGLYTGSFERTGEKQYDGYDVPGQNWVVYSLSTPHLAPINGDPRRPRIKICGAYATAEDARAHATHLHASTQESVLVSSMRAWALAQSGPHRSTEDVEAKRSLLLTQYDDALRVDRAAFQERVKKAHANEPAPELAVIKEDTTRSTRIDALSARLEALKTDEASTASAPHPRAHEVRDQDYVVISFVPDTTPGALSGDDDAEFAFCVHACVPSQDMADAYVRDAAGDACSDHDIYVVRMYEWLDPVHELTREGGGGKSHYRNKELHAIAKFRSEEADRVAGYRKWCEEQSITPNVIDLAKKEVDVGEAPRLTATPVDARADHVGDDTDAAPAATVQKDVAPPLQAPDAVPQPRTVDVARKREAPKALRRKNKKGRR